MADKIVLSDRIKEFSHTTGVAPFTLDGAATGFSAFGDFYTPGDAVFYAATDGTKYEVGSGTYITDGSNNKLTRNPFRSSSLTSGPYYASGTSNAGTTAGTLGYYYPLYLTESAAKSVTGATSAHEHTFVDFPGITFYMPNNHMAHGEEVPLSGGNYSTSGNPVSFAEGIKEIYVTYPGKYSVFTGFGLPGLKEPKASGIAFWANEQTLCYDNNLVWNPSGDKLGIYQVDPQYALDIGGNKSYSLIRASGFIDGGSGIMFSGVAGSYSGGQQLEPFFRNELDNQTGTDAVFSLSGLVDQRLLFTKQNEGMVFAGPASGSCSAACDPDYPTFRYLTVNDIPGFTSYPYVSQFNDDNPNSDGALAIYKSSGIVKYDNSFVVKDDTNRLGVNTASPAATLDVFGDVRVSGDVYISGVITSVVDAPSGYFKHIVFPGSIRIGYDDYTFASTWNPGDDVVAVGTYAGTNSYGNNRSVMLGHYAGRETQGSTYSNLLGNYAGYQASGNIACDMLGHQVGLGCKNNVFSTMIGVEAGTYSSGTLNAVMIGVNAGQHASGSNTSNFIGRLAGAYTTTSVFENIIGYYAGYSSSGNDNNNLMGTYAGREATGCKRDNIFGYHAGYQAIDCTDSNLIGYYAGSNASGTHNNYIGYQAGYNASGNQNIEIVSSGDTYGVLANGTILSNKLHIENTVVGDTAIRRLAVGWVNADYLTPRATLEVVPSAISDVGIIVSGITGHTANLFEAHSGDATVLANITPDGSFETSGTISADNGILFPDLVPNPTTLKLYNDGGTLKWNGATVDTAGSNTFKMNDGTKTDDTITAGQVVTISGVSGISTDYTAATNVMRISGKGISGVIDNVSGWVTGSINSLPGGYGSWGLSVGTAAPDPITSTQSVIISGVSGVETEYTSFDNVLRVSAINLSGALQPQITALSAGGGTVGSGLVVRMGVTHMDVEGSGQLEHLIFNNDQIRIGNKAGRPNSDIHETSGSYWTAIGHGAGWGASGHDYTNMIGFEAGYISSGNDNSNLIGKYAGVYSTGCVAINIIGGGGSGAKRVSSANIIGQAGTKAIDCDYVDMIGTFAGENASGCSYTTMQGYWAGKDVINNDNTTMLGFAAGMDSIEHNSAIMIGRSAGGTATGCNDTNMIGREAGANASGCEKSNFIGYLAGNKATGCSYGNMIGNYAGYLTTGIFQSNLIGDNAGNQAKDSSWSNIIGKNAGYESSGNNNTNIFGHNAAYNASGNPDITTIGNHAGYQVIKTTSGNIIGSNAGYESSGNANPIMIGTYAGSIASGNIDSTMIGFNAGYQATGCNQTIIIGSLAGYQVINPTLTNMFGFGAGNLSSGNVSSNMVGTSAGYLATGCDYTNIIGQNAGKKASGCDYSEMIGANAGFEASGTANAVMIGQSAGRRSYNNDESTFVGPYAGTDTNSSTRCIYLGYFAGAYRAGDSSVILKTTSSSDSGATWADYDTDGIVDIANIIQGRSTDTRKELRIGAELDNDPVGAGEDELTDTCLSVKSQQSSDVTLTVIPAASQSVAQLESTRLTDSTRNEIITKDGFLRIPVAQYHDATDLYESASADADKIIPRVNGAVAAYASDGYEFLFVCMGSTWYGTAELTAL